MTMSGPDKSRTELVVVSADDATALVEEIARLVAFLDRVPDVSLADVAYTCALKAGPSVLAVVAKDVPELRSRLASAQSRIAGGTARIRDKSGTYFLREPLIGPGVGKLAYVYPAVNGYYPDMMRDLAVLSPACRGAFDELEEAMNSERGYFTPSDFIFPPASYYRHDADIFRSGAYAQALVATYSASAAMTRLYRDLGLVRDGVVGFAGGDLASAMESGLAGTAIPRPDRIGTIRDIYRIVHDAVNHGGMPKTSMMAVVLRRGDDASRLDFSKFGKAVRLAIDLSPRQRTYAVDPAAEEDFVQACSAAGARTVKLTFDRPFNTSDCERLSSKLSKFADGHFKKDPVCDVYSCGRAEPLPRSARKCRHDAAERWSQTVRFVETVRRMYADGYRVFVEMGPGGLMTTAVDDILAGRPHAAIATNATHRSGLLQLQHATAQLLAFGAKLDLSKAYARRSAHRLDFSSALSLEVRRDAEMRLSRSFPRMMLLSDGESLLGSASILAEPRGRGAKAAARQAAAAAQSRKQRQFDYGTVMPMVSDAETIRSSPGVTIEIAKTFRISDMPFLGDFALGTSQLSYTDPNLRGLINLTIPVAAEIMGEVAQQLVPSRTLVAVEDLTSRRTVSFEKGQLALVVLAERIASDDPALAAVKVQIRENAPGATFTWPVMEATFRFAQKILPGVPARPEPLLNPRTVHWSGRDIYPSRVSCGNRLRAITFAEAWGECGLDYEVMVPALAGNFAFTSYPTWTVNPLLFGVVISGFQLWRGHERFEGAFSYPIRLRRLTFRTASFREKTTLKCYLRLTGVTPKSHLCDIVVTDGNGQTLAELSGWEELTERVPKEYCEAIRQPAVGFLTKPLAAGTVGDPMTDVATAFVTDVPYPIFERNENFWLKTLSRVVLSAREREEFSEMTGSAARRTEWLFGRIAAKEAVRRYMKDFYQARWSDADVQVWADPAGKPVAIGEWGDYLKTRLDISIAHTAQFVVAVAAANARVGVDVESVNRDLSEEFAAGVFTPEERELATQSVNSAQSLVRFWCAKEAVSKALGTGIRYSPREMVVTGYVSEAGRITMQLTGQWLDAFKGFRGRDIPVTVRVLRDHALAFCFIPASLFDEE